MSINDKGDYTDIDAAFSKARDRLRSKYTGPARAHASQEFKHFAGRVALHKLYRRDIPNEQFSEKLKIALINHFAVEGMDILYNWILSKTSHSGSYDKKIIGEYKYWRNFPTDEYQSVFEIRVGTLRIQDIHGVLYYQHRSANAVSSEWEDDGVAILFDSRLYCIGFRKSNIRLIICKVPYDLKSEHLHGIVLSTQISTQKIFSAAFGMFHQSHPKFQLSKKDLSLSDLKSLGLADPYMDFKIMLD